MSDAVAAELLAIKKKRQAEYLAKGSTTIPEWVFMSRGRLLKMAKDGEPEKRDESKRIDMHNVETRHFTKCLGKAGLRRIRFHDLRHTFASLLIQNRESLAYIKDTLGHSSIKVTVDVYGHLVPGANRQAVNKLPTLNCAVGSASQAARKSR